MHKAFILVLLLWGGLGSTASACEWLPIQIIQQATEISGPIEYRSQGTDRCLFSWKKPDFKAIELENQERIRNAMRRGQNNDQTRISSWATIAAELISVTKTEAQARQQFENYLGHQIRQSYGSPDPLNNTNWKKVTAAEGQTAWSKQSQKLLIQKGNKLAFLEVKVKDSPEKNLELALKIAAGLTF